MFSFATKKVMGDMGDKIKGDKNNDNDKAGGVNWLILIQNRNNYSSDRVCYCQC